MSRAWVVSSNSALLVNEYHDCGFDLCLTYGGIACGRKQMERYHAEIFHILEALILQEDADFLLAGEVDTGSDIKPCFRGIFQIGVY